MINKYVFLACAALNLNAFMHAILRFEFGHIDIAQMVLILVAFAMSWVAGVWLYERFGER